MLLWIYKVLEIVINLQSSLQCPGLYACQQIDIHVPNHINITKKNTLSENILAGINAQGDINI